MSFVAEIDAKIDGFVTKLDVARGKMDVFSKTIGQRISEIGSKFKKLGGVLTIGVTAPLALAGKSAFNMAADFEDALGATDEIFKSSSESVKEWSNNLKTYFGISKQEALEYSNMMGSMLINIGGLTEDQASKQSAKLIELAGDLTAMYGGTTQDAVRALTGSLKGNNTMLDNYGMAVNDALVKNKAFTLGLIKQGEEMSLAAKQTATLALIYEQTGAAQGQAAREADGSSGSMRELRTEITNLTTEIGSALLPIITPLIQKLSAIARSFRGMTPEMQKAIVSISAVAAAIGPLLLGLGSIMKLAPMVGSAFALITGPVGLIVSAVGGATYLIIKYWDDIKEYFTSGGGSQLFESAKNLAESLKNTIARIFENIRTIGTAIWDKFGKNITSIFKVSFDNVLTVLDAALKTIANVFDIITAILKGDIRGALDGFKNLFIDIFNSVIRIASNIQSGIASAISLLFKSIGLDSMAAKVDEFNNRVTPALNKFSKSTKETTEVVNEQEAAVKRSTVALNENAKEIDNNAKKQSDFRNELNEVLAGWGMYDAQMAVINRRFIEVNTLAKNAGATIEEMAVIANRRLSEGLDATLGSITNKLKKLQNTFDKGGFLGGVSNASAIVIPVELGELRSGVYGKALSSYTKAAIEYGEAFNESFNMVIEDGVRDAIAGLAESLGTSLIEGGNVIEAMGASMLSSMGSVLKKLGEMALMTGIGIKAVQESLKSLNPYAAIAAGVALVALGSAFSAGAKKLGGSMGSGGGYSSVGSLSNTGIGDSQLRGVYNDDFTVTFVQRGDDLVGVLDTAQQRRGRLV